MAGQSVEQRLEVAGSLLFTQTTWDMRLTGARQSGTRRVAWSAVGKCCDFCEYMDGKVFDANDAVLDRIYPPHINCDCVLTIVGDREQGTMDLFDANDEQYQQLLADHAHFAQDGSKYQALRLPAAPSGRDVTFRRGKDGAPGTLEWHVPRYRLPELGNVVETGVEATGEQWRALDLPPAGASVGELEAWAKERFPEVDFDFAGATSELVQPALRQWAQLRMTWPEAMAKQVEFSTQAHTDALYRAWTSGDGQRLLLNPVWWSSQSMFEGSMATARRYGWSAPGAFGPDAVLTEEYAHQLKRWLGEDTAIGRELDAWLRDNALPASLGHLNPNDIDTDERRLQESFARGLVARFNGVGVASDPWVEALWRKVTDLTTRVRRGHN